MLVVGLIGAGVVVRNALQSGGPAKAGAPCQVTATSKTYGLDVAQAANTTTVTAVGKRLGMPDHAVSIALATAFLESGLHNLTHGDRDSVGLFQQRPSQGWGTAAQILTPHYAAAAFYQHLAKVPGWQTLAVTDAAQRVQRSALPHGYAQFEPEGRALAIATTGEVAAGLSCRAAIPATAPARSLRQATTQELGAPALGVALAPARGWTVASWLVAHAVELRITSVAYGGLRWSPSTGRWQPDLSAGTVVDIVRTPAAAAVP